MIDKDDVYPYEDGLIPYERDPDFEYDPEQPVNPNPNFLTLCTGDRKDNVFYEPGQPGYPGRRVLDELTFEQVYLVLLRVPKAKADLMRITDDPSLLAMARESRIAEDPIDEDEKIRKRLTANSLPMYTVFKGNFP